MTELVYRKQIRPVVENGATVMDRIFGQASTTRSHSTEPDDDESPGQSPIAGS